MYLHLHLYLKIVPRKISITNAYKSVRGQKRVQSPKIRSKHLEMINMHLILCVILFMVDLALAPDLVFPRLLVQSCGSIFKILL